MPQVIGTPPREHTSRTSLEPGGRPVSPLDVIAGVIFVAGIVAFALGFIVRAHVAASAIGITAFVVGMFAQLVSATRNQRVFIVTGLVAAFVGGALAIAHGGFG